MSTTQKVEINSTAVHKPWSQKLAEMDVGATLLVDMRSSITVRALISSKMPIYNPEMKFTTKKIKVFVDKEEVPVIEVTKTA